MHRATAWRTYALALTVALVSYGAASVRILAPIVRDLRGQDS